MVTRAQRAPSSPLTTTWSLLCAALCWLLGVQRYGVMAPNPGEPSLEGHREVLCFLDPKMALVTKYFIDSRTMFREARHTEKPGL